MPTRPLLQIRKPSAKHQPSNVLDATFSGEQSRSCSIKPFWDDDWVERISGKLGLEFTLRKREIIRGRS